MSIGRMLRHVNRTIINQASVQKLLPAVRANRTDPDYSAIIFPSVIIRIVLSRAMFVAVIGFRGLAVV